MQRPYKIYCNSLEATISKEWSRPPNVNWGTLESCEGHGGGASNEDLWSWSRHYQDYLNGKRLIHDVHALSQNLNELLESSWVITALSRRKFPRGVKQKQNGARRRRAKNNRAKIQNICQHQFSILLIVVGKNIVICQLRIKNDFDDSDESVDASWNSVINAAVFVVIHLFFLLSSWDMMPHHSTDHIV